MAAPEQGAFPHFLIKEIHEQPTAVRATALGQIDADTNKLLPLGAIGEEELCAVKKIYIAASGSSRHAGMVGKSMIRELANLPVEVEYASEFGDTNLAASGELTVLITQSGETSDTLSALRKAKIHGSRTLAVTNVTNSTIAREADSFIETHAGPEISIASTKAFNAQLAAMFLLAVRLGATHGTLQEAQLHKWLQELMALPEKLSKALKLDSACRELAQQYYQTDDFFFIGRGIHCPIAMDGALKFKETSYIHAEGYPAGELRHGPFALISSHFPVETPVPPCSS